MILWLVAPAAQAADDWFVLQEEQVAVRCRVLRAGFTECEATAILDVEPSSLVALLADPADWPSIFPSVQAVSALGDASWAVDVDLPWPFGMWSLIGSWEHQATLEGDWFHLDRHGAVNGLWSEAWWNVTETAAGSVLAYRWHSQDLSLPRGLRHVIHRRIGHDTLWGVALAADTEPTAPDRGSGDGAPPDGPAPLRTEAALHPP